MQVHKPYYQKHIVVCVNERDNGESCKPKGSAEIHAKIKEFVAENNLKDKIRVSKSLCQDLCSFGPVVSIYPDNVVYKQVLLSDVDKIIELHIKEKQV